MLRLSFGASTTPQKMMEQQRVLSKEWKKHSEPYLFHPVPSSLNFWYLASRSYSWMVFSCTSGLSKWSVIFETTYKFLFKCVCITRYLSDSCIQNKFFVLPWSLEWLKFDYQKHSRWCLKWKVILPLCSVQNFFFSFFVSN